jgi:CO/xanthine dehydrogenase Mo-binding subunit
LKLEVHGADAHQRAKAILLAIQRYTNTVDGCGVVVNPMLVEGQIHGGAVQGLGGALLED